MLKSNEIQICVIDNFEDTIVNNFAWKFVQNRS